MFFFRESLARYMQGFFRANGFLAWYLTCEYRAKHIEASTMYGGIDIIGVNECCCAGAKNGKTQYFQPILF